MGIFRRPELEKDNPVAPEPYIGPRRRLAMARVAAAERSIGGRNAKETLRALVDAANRFLKELPEGRKPGKNLVALREAIAKADQVLAAQTEPRSSLKRRRR